MSPSTSISSGKLSASLAEGKSAYTVNPPLFTGMLLFSILMLPSITSLIFVLERSDSIILSDGIPWGGILH